MILLASILFTVSMILLAYFSIPESGFNKLFNPFFAFTIFHCFVFFCVPALQYIYGFGRFNSIYILELDEYVIYSMFIAACYNAVVLFLASICSSGFKFEHFTLEKINFDRSSNFSFYVITILALIGLYGCINIVFNYIGNYAQFMFDRINILSGKGPYLMLLKFLLPVCLFLYLKRLKFGRRKDFWLLLIFLFIIFFINLFLGSRTAALMAFIYCFIALFMVSNAKKRFGLTCKGVVAVCLVFTIMSGLGVVRDLVKKDGLEITVDSISNSSTHNTEPRIVETLRINYGQTELLSFLIHNFDINQYAEGRTFLAGFLNFIPRSIWANKPTGGGPLLANTISPGSYVLGGKSGNTSYTTGFVVESYLNLGFIGVLILAIVHFLLIRAVIIYSKKVTSPIKFIIFIFLYMAAVMGFTTGEFSGMFITIVSSVLPLYILTFIRFK